MSHTTFTTLPRWLALALLATCFAFSTNVSAEVPRTAFVHLFEWSWNDIAKECEDVLGPKGFSAVQVSPPQGHIDGPAWWTRYQPTNYSINSRSGNRAEFASMVQRCNAVGVEIYVDAVINHMAAGSRYYPEVPFYEEHFHTCFTNIDYSNRWSIQNCGLSGLNDLATDTNYVQQKIADYMNDLISLGVTGFRIDAAKHMPSGDIAAIKAKLNGNPYIFQEVIGAFGEPVTPDEYTWLGDVTEFQYEKTMAHHFRDGGKVKDLGGLNSWSGWLPSSSAVVFVANHDDQRQHPEYTITHKDENGLYYLAHIYMLAYPYGYPKVMSSYHFNDHDQGPPSSGPHTGDSCDNNWVCEHRWRGIANMVAFRNHTAEDWTINNWWDNGNNQIAFGRGDSGFVVINREYGTLNVTLQTGMPAGEYCDVVNGEFNNGQCAGSTINVDNSGNASFSVSAMNASAIHIGAKIGSGDNDNQPPPVETHWDNAFFRGTANGWSTSAMTLENDVWVTVQNFGTNNPRFKIDHHGDWTEAYPAQDYPITEGAGDYRITFDDTTMAITVEKLTTPPPPPPTDRIVDFNCNNGHTYMGQSVYVVGSIAALGSWSPASAVKLDPTSYPTWTGSITVPAGNDNITWKCIKRSENNANDGLVWQPGSDNVLQPSDTSSSGSF